MAEWRDALVGGDRAGVRHGAGVRGAFGGFTAFVIVLVLGVVGFLAGRALTGELDLTELLGLRKRT